MMAAVLALGLMIALGPSVAQASTPKRVPCHAQTVIKSHIDCTWTRPGNGISAGSIVVFHGARVGFLHRGTNWIACQQRGAAVRSPSGHHNLWYAWTRADNGRVGWASALDAHGGDENQPFGGTPLCNNRHGLAPSIAGTWGATPPKKPPPPPPCPRPAGKPVEC